MRKNTIFLSCLIFSVCAALSACTTYSVPTASGSSVSTSKTAAPDNLTRQGVLDGIAKLRSTNAYVLQPGDLVDIQVFREEEMNRTLRISGDGTITFPLVGTVEIAGLSIQDAQDKLAEYLRTYLREPQVSMLVKEYGNKSVYVLGQVKRPSSIQIPPEKQLTVLEAISSVGGFTDIANTSKVRVLRMENNQQKTIDVDVSQITKLGNKALDIALMPGDVVFVPQSMF